MDRKKRNRWMALALPVAALLALGGCQDAPASQACREIRLAFDIECEEEIYGVTFEYGKDRKSAGRMTVSRNPERSAPLFKDRSIRAVFCEFYEEGASVAGVQEEERFGVLVSVTLENGETVPVEYLLEWRAAYGEEYRFTLSGGTQEGFAFAPADDETAYTMTPYDALPAGWM